MIINFLGIDDIKKKTHKTLKCLLALYVSVLKNICFPNLGLFPFWSIIVHSTCFAVCFSCPFCLRECPVSFLFFWFIFPLLMALFAQRSKLISSPRIYINPTHWKISDVLLSLFLNNPHILSDRMRARWTPSHKNRQKQNEPKVKGNTDAESTAVNLVNWIRKGLRVL